MKLPVIYRREKSGKYNDVVAVFPSLPGTNDPLTMECYAHVGQHSSCHIDWYWQRTRPAKEEEYRALHQELVSIYTTPPDPIELVAVKRITPAMVKLRMAELNH